MSTAEARRLTASRCRSFWRRTRTSAVNFSTDTLASLICPRTRISVPRRGPRRRPRPPDRRGRRVPGGFPRALSRFPAPAGRGGSPTWLPRYRRRPGRASPRAAGGRPYGSCDSTISAVAWIVPSMAFWRAALAPRSSLVRMSTRRSSPFWYSRFAAARRSRSSSSALILAALATVRSTASLVMGLKR